MRRALTLMFACVVPPTHHWSPAAADSLVRVAGMDKSVRQVSDALQRGTTLWFATNRGVYYVTESGYTARQLLPLDTADADLEVCCLEIVDDAIWLGTQNGLFVVEKAGFRSIALRDTSGDPAFAVDVKMFSLEADPTNGVVWIGSSRGLFRKAANSMVAERVPLAGPLRSYQKSRKQTSRVVFDEEIGVFAVQLIGEGDVLSVTSRGVFKSHDGKFTALADIEPYAFRRAVSSNGRYYINTRSGMDSEGGNFYFVGEDALLQMEDSVRDIEAIGADVWLSIGGEILSVYHREGPFTRDFPLKGIKMIRAVDDLVLLASNTELYLHRPNSGEGFRLLARKESRLENDQHPFALSGVLKTGTSIWLYGSAGVYRILQDVGVTVELRARKKWYGGGAVAVEKISYERNGVDPFRHLAKEFWVIAHTNEDAFNAERYDTGCYTELSEAGELTVPRGETEVWIGVRDSHGAFHALRKNVVVDKHWVEKALGSLMKRVLNPVAGAAVTFFFLVVSIPYVWSWRLWSRARERETERRQTSPFIYGT